MEINLSNGQIIEINLGGKECNIKIGKEIFTEKINGLNVAIVGDEYDEEFKDSFIRNIYQRCIGIGNNKYKMCLDYRFKILL